MFHSLVVSQVQNVRGRQVWDGARVAVKTEHGDLELWKVGENGGNSEVWHAYLRTCDNRNPPTVADLVALADNYNLRRGDLVIASRLPNPVFENGVIIGYRWKYSPGGEGVSS